MGCTIKLLTKLKKGTGVTGLDSGQYGKDVENVLVSIGEVDSAKDADGKDLHVPQAEVTYATVADLVSRLDRGKRAHLAEVYRNATVMRLTKKDIENCNFISNVSLDDLHETRRLSRKFHRIPGNLEGESYTILDCNALKYGGDRYSGMLTRADGSKILLSNSEEAAEKIYRFLNARAALKAGFAEEGFEEWSETWRNRELIGKIAAGMSKREKGRLGGRSLTLTDLLYDYLENAQSYAPMEIDGKRVNIQRVLDTAVYEVTKKAYNAALDEAEAAERRDAEGEGREYDSGMVRKPDFRSVHWIDGIDHLDDLGADIRRVADPKSGLYRIVVGKKEFYDVLDGNIAGFKEAHPVGEFMRMGEEEMDTLLFGVDGLFAGHAWLKDMEVESVDETELASEGGETVDLKPKRRSARDFMRNNWERLTADLPDGDPAKGTLDDFGKREMTLDERNRRLEELGFKVTDGDGTWQVKADRDEKGKVRYYYNVERQKTTGETYRRSYIRLKRPYKYIGGDEGEAGERAGSAAFSRQTLLEPVSADGGPGYGFVKDGQYHGMYVYVMAGEDTDEESGRRYYISRNVASGRIVDNPFTTLQAALDAVDRENAFGKLEDTAYITLKQPGGNLFKTFAEGRGLQPGQTLSVLDYSLSGVAYGELPAVFKAMFTMSGERFHEQFDASCGTGKLVTPEMCAAWLMAQCADLKAKGLTAGVTGRDAAVRAIRANHSADPDRWIAEVDRIAGSDRVHYRVLSAYDMGAKTKAVKRNGKVEKVRTDNWKKRENPVQQVRLIPLVDDRNGLSVRGDMVGNVKVGEYMDRYLDSAVKKIGAEFANVHRVSVEDMKMMPEFANCSYDQLAQINGFYRGGDVYINVSNTSAAEEALYEETVHMLMGVLKVKDRAAYDAVIAGWENELRLRGVRANAAGVKTPSERALQRALDDFVNDHPYYAGFARSDLVEEWYAREFARKFRDSGDLHMLTDADGAKAGERARIISGNTFNPDVFRRAFEGVFGRLQKAYESERATGSRGTGGTENGLGFKDWLVQVSESREAARGRTMANLIRSLIRSGGDDGITEEC